MKTVCIVVPTYNEEENIPLVYARVCDVFSNLNYAFEILFIDNYSTDMSRIKILHLCEKDKRVKSIFNAKNFGFTRSTFYGLSQATGDCAVLMFADLQDPPEVIPEFLNKWESGNKVVVGIKNKSRENKLMYFFRKCYYLLVEKISDVDHISQFVGFGLYDRSFLKVLASLDDPLPYLRGIVAEMAFQRTDVYYEQEKRQKGKSSFNFFNLYDTAMLGITSYSKVLMRLATIFGFLLALLSAIIAIVTLVIKLLNWNYFSMGTAAIVVGVFLIGSVQLFFIGLLGEYVLNINTRVMHRPLVIEEKRINFEKDESV